MERAQAQSVPVNRSGAALPPASPSRMPREPRRLKKGLYRFYPDSPCFIFLCQFLCLHTLRTNSAFRFFIFLILAALFREDRHHDLHNCDYRHQQRPFVRPHHWIPDVFRQDKGNDSSHRRDDAQQPYDPFALQLALLFALFTARRMELRSIALFCLVLLTADEVARK